MNAENHAQIARCSAFDDQVAAERGRLFAVRNMIEDSEKRREMEGVFGLPYCKMRFPEVYSQDKSEWKPVIDLIPGMGEVSTGPKVASGKPMVLVLELPA